MNSVKTNLNGSYAFYNTSTALSIYVPTSLVNTYKTATNWTYISSRIIGI